MATWLYNLLLLPAGVAVLFVVARKRQVVAGLAMFTMFAFLSLVLALALCEDMFGAVWLLAYGIFLHGTNVLGAAAALIWRHNRVVSGLLAFASATLIAVAVDAFLIEPTWLEVTHHTQTSDKLDEPLRIVLIADIQTDSVGEYERFVLEKALAEQPDLIVLAGDDLQTHDPAIQYLARSI